MANDYVVVDSGAFQNLFQGGGASAWDQLLVGGRKIILSSVIEDEIRRAENEFSINFDTWRKSKNIPIVQFELTDLRREDGSFKEGAGDKTLRALLDPNNADAQAAMRAAGVDANGTFRLLTDDAGFLKKNMEYYQFW
jgi:hypothetical protein